MNDIWAHIEDAAEKLNADQAWLFGSYSRGNATESSDVDVLFIVESDLPRPRRTANAYRVMRSWSVAKDIVVYTPEEFLRWRHVKGALCNNVLTEGVRVV
ncbi:MAG: nucleotidyltransferase domain-containing protein [Mariprofundaceae bacterium]|nr:nucleotidyltransferase domain-containing protein [Mariprofundaceae bacterium]